MLDSKFAQHKEVAQKSVELSIQIVIITEILITLVIAASLKSMWNLLNVAQVLAYMRFYVNWPAFMDQILMWIDNAITMKPVTDQVFDFGKSKFEILNQTLPSEDLKNAGITDFEMFKSLGIFVLTMIAILAGVVMYWVLKSMEKKVKVAQKGRRFIGHRLFFSSFLRFMIVSNMELTVTVWGYFIYSYGQDSLEYKLYATCYAVGIVGMLIYPLFLMVFLMRNQSTLGTPRKMRKFSSIYDGIDFDSRQALLYSTIFSLRRFYIVYVNVAFNAGFPLTNYSQPRYLYKIACFFLVQTLYLVYISDTQPHISTIFNRLELVNECSLVFLAYIMIAFSGVI